MRKNYTAINITKRLQIMCFSVNALSEVCFELKNGYVIHADINASFNIIRKVTGDIIYNFVDKVSIRGSCPKRVKINLA